MKLLKIKKQNNGFTLIEVLIAAAILSIIIVGVIQVMKMQSKTFKSNMASNEIMNLNNDVRAFLSKRGTCDKSFEGKTFTKVVRVDSLKKSNGTPKYVVAKKYGNNLIKIKSIKLENFDPDDPEGLSGTADLTIVYEKLGDVYGGKTITRKNPISVSLNAQRKIIICGESFLSSSIMESFSKETFDSKDSSRSKDSSFKTKEKLIQAAITSESTPTKKQEDGQKEKIIDTAQFQLNLQKALDDNPKGEESKEVIKLKEIINTSPELKKLKESILQMQKSNEEMKNE